jgi:DNA-directed RNA polymerase specialized sigma24 family protein
MTDEQIKEFISLKPQFVKYIYTCLKGATFFHPNDLINEAFIKLSNQKNPIKDVRLSGLYFIKRRLMDELRRSSYKPLLRNIFPDNSLNEQDRKPDASFTYKGNEDNYKGNTLVHSNYDFNKISQILNFYPDQEIKEITLLKFQGLSYKEIMQTKRNLNISIKEYTYRIKKLKLYISKTLDLDYHKIERNKIIEINKKLKNNNIKVNPIIVKVINTGRTNNKELKIKSILELKKENLNNNQIAKKLNISRSLVTKYLNDGNNKTN